MKSLEEVEQIVKERLSEKRYKHSVYVKNQAIRLAKIYGENEEEAALVGIAHDVAKEIPKDEKLAYCAKNSIDVDDVEIINQELLHAKIGKDIAIKEFGFSERMGNAIEYHTTGKVGMDLLAKILFIADSISEDRMWDGVQKGRELADENLDDAILYFLNSTLERTIKENWLIHLDSVNLRNECLKNQK